MYTLTLIQADSISLAPVNSHDETTLRILYTVTKDAQSRIMSDRNSPGSGIMLATVGVRALTIDLVGLAMALAWIGFWLMVAFLHYQQGDLIATVVTGIGLTLPGLGLLAWRFFRHH